MDFGGVPRTRKRTGVSYIPPNPKVAVEFSAEIGDIENEPGSREMAVEFLDGNPEVAVEFSAEIGDIENEPLRGPHLHADPR